MGNNKYLRRILIIKKIILLFNYFFNLKIFFKKYSNYILKVVYNKCIVFFCVIKEEY